MFKGSLLKCPYCGGRGWYPTPDGVELCVFCCGKREGIVDGDGVSDYQIWDLPYHMHKELNELLKGDLQDE